ncbi:hypothetical protein [Paludisphaera mucosa]|uniref:Uncharacterized protein n=1 Tax=Paludisphaera mucosa TaxID=3030827 RepID=A0ABT6FAR8_9BACT|nr:hypothetical protein [Paludisphaera mucosa]MDG3004687.1 hypothetical protein [Paludisphaera mucosa]
MSDQEALLARWKALAGDHSRRPWTPDHLAGFFQNFRPHGVGLAEVFEGVEGADEITPRLLEIYRATAEGWRDDGGYDAYFNVKSPVPLAAPRAVELVLGHLEKVRAMAEVLGRDDLVASLDPAPAVDVVVGETPWPPGPDDVESTIYEVVGDYMALLTPRESPALGMEEGLWTIAGDYNLRHYVLWPLYRGVGTIEEPFQPYFELWRHGAGYRFTPEGAVHVYTPAGAASP